MCMQLYINAKGIQLIQLIQLVGRQQRQSAACFYSLKVEIQSGSNCGTNFLPPCFIAVSYAMIGDLLYGKTDGMMITQIHSIGRKPCVAG